MTIFYLEMFYKNASKCEIYRRFLCMKIQAIQSNDIQPQFQGLFKKDVTTPQQENKKINKKEVVKISAAVLATALAATTITNIIRGKAYSKQLRRVEENFRRQLDTVQEPFRRKIDDLSAQLTTERNTSAGLRRTNQSLSESNQRLQQEAAAARERLNEILEGGTEGVQTRIYGELKSVTDQAELGYNVMEPPVTGLGQKKVYTDAVDLPPRVGTTNREAMRAIDIPEIETDGRFHFEMPTSEEVKISEVEKSRNFTPRRDQMTTVSEGYADSVEWDNNKIARDILQNFYDGHGQTLDGVRFNFEPVGNGRFRVRIEGDSSYTADKAIFLGESTKRDDAKSAGNYGEGLKMASLKLIKNKGAEHVRIGSDNWDLTFKLMENDLTDKQVMGYDLEKTAKKAGNYIEFETDDRDLLDSLRNTINRFYHSGNEHFKTPDFENDIFGLRVLKQPKEGLFGKIPGEKGGIYIAGQRFEYEGDYDGLEGAIIFLKEKPPKKVLDPSRDRTTLNESDLINIAGWLCSDYRISKADRIAIINALEPVWGKDASSPLASFFDRFCYYQANFADYGNRATHINFPTNYVAYSSASPEMVAMLERRGYKVCNENMAGLGMQTIKDLMGDARKHDPIQPTEAQMKKLAVLKEGIKKLAPSLKAEGFSDGEINTRIFLFNNSASKEAKLYSSTLAEAIIDGGQSKGFWLDRAYLDRADFSEVLETALHEMSHKVGGDESMEFSYKLTDVNKRAIQQILEEPKTRNELQALSRLWKEYSAPAATV